MTNQLRGWQDAHGTHVQVGDWIEVWCTWTGQPKFDGRAVQIVDVLSARGQSVFRLRDPLSQSSHNYMAVNAAGFRRVADARESLVVPREPLPDYPEDPTGT